jgi:ATP-dependent protease ClpP protease subunit
MNVFNLLGDIVQDDSQKYFESDIVPAMVIGWLAKQDGDIEVNINSLGGSVMAGLAIANAFKAYSKGKVTANVLGVAASMASVVACAADEIRMGKGSFMMIHNPWSIALGDAEALRKEAETLDKMKDAIIGFYQSKFSVPPMELAKYMDDETWIEDKDCELYGLAATPLVEDLPAAAKCDTRLMFAHAPEAATAFYAHKEAQRPAPVAEDWEARYKGASKKLNEMQEAHKAELAAMESRHSAALVSADDAHKVAMASAEEAHKVAMDELMAKHEAAINEFRSQVETLRGDLEKAKADLSSAVARAETAEKDLAAKGEQLDRLNKAHALLTGGVLSPGEGTDAEQEYQSALKAAKSPEQREEIRKAHAKTRTTKKTR